MSDFAEIKLATLTGADLRVLADNLRRLGRHEMAAQVTRELVRRAGAAGDGIPDAHDIQEAPRRRRAAWGVAAGAAALGAVGALILVPRMGPDAPAPPAATAPPPPRAMVARPAEPAAPPVTSPEVAEAATERPRPAEPVRPPAEAVRRPTERSAERPTQLALRSDPPALPSPSPPASPVEAVAAPSEPPSAAPVAVSRSAPVLAAACGDGAAGAEGLVCEEARRAALRSGQIRGAPVPLQVAITPPRSASLASPGLSAAPR